MASITIEEWYKFFLTVLATAFGLLFGLLINSLVNHHRNKKAYRAMLAAIKSEARANKVILDESFTPYFKSGLVLREFSVGTVSQYLANSLFTQYATASGIEVLNAYLRDLRLANAYRVRAERIQVSGEGEEFQESIIENWGKSLKQCESDIDQVTNLENGNLSN